MEYATELKLIEGFFSPDEAREILMNVFLSKINFHKGKNFSSEERFGKEDVYALKRIPELKRTIESINELIENAKNNNQTLEITSEITIKSSNK